MIFLPKNSWGTRKTNNRGRGLFTKKQIKKGIVIGDYLGTVVSNLDFDFQKEPYNSYIMYYHSRASILPQDINSEGIHCINHSCQPNCWIYPYHGHSLFFAIRNIAKNEELTVSYLYAPKGDSCKTKCPHVCQCESINCTGSMHLTEDQFKIWQDFVKNELSKTSKKQIYYNKPLAKLKSYPKKIIFSFPSGLYSKDAREQSK